MRLLLRSALAAAAIVAPVTFAACGDEGTDPIEVSSVVVTAAPSHIQVGETVQLMVVVKDAAGFSLTGRTVTFESSAPAVATVSTQGLVTGVSAGAAVITATSEGVEGRVTITVSEVPVALVRVTPADPSVTVGETVQLTAAVEDIDGNELTDKTVTWSSSDTDVATVSATGLVDAVGAGEADITATSEGVEGSTTVTVTTADFSPQEETDLP